MVHCSKSKFIHSFILFHFINNCGAHDIYVVLKDDEHEYTWRMHATGNFVFFFLFNHITSYYVTLCYDVLCYSLYYNWQAYRFFFKWQINWIEMENLLRHSNIDSCDFSLICSCDSNRTWQTRVENLKVEKNADSVNRKSKEKSYAAANYRFIRSTAFNFIFNLFSTTAHRFPPYFHSARTQQKKYNVTWKMTWGVFFFFFLVCLPACLLPIFYHFISFHWIEREWISMRVRACIRARAQ